MATSLAAIICISLERTATDTWVGQQKGEHCLSRKDGEASWTPSKDLKEGDPIITAQYDVANKIATEPAFVW